MKAIFVLIFAVVAWFSGVQSFDVLDVIVLGLAASFAGRSLSYLTIFEWLRRPLAQVVDHSSGAGQEVHPKKDLKGFWKGIAELICCPVCSATWSAAVLLWLPPVFTYLFAAASVAWSNTLITELVEWSRHKAQEETGKLNGNNKKKEVPHDYPDPYDPRRP